MYVRVLVDCAVHCTWELAPLVQTCLMQVFSHPHVTVQRRKQERYNARVASFLEECDDIEAHKNFRLLYQGEY